MSAYFSPSGPPSSADACTHEGLWEAATIAGFGLQMCTGCGATFGLMIHEGQLYWREVEHLTSDDLEQAMQPVRSDQDGPDRIQPESGEGGRPGRTVQVVPGDVEREAARVPEGVE